MSFRDRVLFEEEARYAKEICVFVVIIFIICEVYLEACRKHFDGLS